MVFHGVQAWFRVRVFAEETSCYCRAGRDQGAVVAEVGLVAPAAAAEAAATEVNLSLGCNGILFAEFCSDSTLVCSVCSLLPTPNVFFSPSLCRCPQQALSVRASGYPPEDTGHPHRDQGYSFLLPFGVFRWPSRVGSVVPCARGNNNVLSLSFISSQNGFHIELA